MDIERLRELEKAVRRDYGFYDDIKSLWKHSEIGKDLLQLIDEAITNQVVAKSATSEEVAEAIEQIESLIKAIENDMYWQADKLMESLDLAIIALKSYQPNVSKMETTGVSSDGFSYDVKAKQYHCLGCLDYFYMPSVCNYCPSCGRRLEGETT